LLVGIGGVAAAGNYGAPSFGSAVLRNPFEVQSVGIVGLPAVQMLPQTAHVGTQFLGFLVAGDRPGAPVARSALTRPQMAALFEESAATGPDTPLQVGTVAITGGALRVRFNQPLDLGRLGAGAERLGQLLLVQRNGAVLAGTVLLDPDARGLAFVPQAGALPDGEYVLRLLSGDNGLQSLQGRPLDGDGDGQPGGDYLGRFILAGNTVRSAAAAGQDFSTPSTVTAVSAVNTVSTDIVVADADRVLWTALTGGIGGAITLAFAPMLRPTRGAVADDRRRRAVNDEDGEGGVSDDDGIERRLAAARVPAHNGPAPRLRLASVAAAPQAGAAAPRWLRSWLRSEASPHTSPGTSPDRPPEAPAEAPPPWHIRL
jgi:hypothetical protein